MSFWKKLKSGLSKTSQTLTQGITSVFTHKKLDEETLDAFEDLLISTDMGVKTATELRDLLKKQRLHQEISEPEIKEWLAEEITKILEPVAASLTIDKKPHVVLVVGVNGAGKTTTIAKLSQQWQEEGKKVLWAAGDTFRSAAVEQLQVWGDRLNIDVCTTKSGGDAAGLAFDAFQKAVQNKANILCIDTAGRLQNKKHLMEELEKIVRVLKKAEPSAPHTVLLVLDATTGQNAIDQVKIFQEIIGINALVITKLDGTAKGGVVVALAKQFSIPIIALGVGESAEDLKSFDASDFSRALVSA
ncbi:MAG: signal recognition particle-docking protein FtsY [Pseudomonadota bacterium]|nr:signal recognition particle-docking protein FtsY [Alphaproteobacteria bacterium]